MNQAKNDNSYLIGLDSGGTKTEILVTKTDGTVLNHLIKQGLEISVTNLGLTSLNIRELLRTALDGLPPAPIAAFTAGLAGMDTFSEEKKAYAVISEALGEYNPGQIELFNDATVALANGTNAPAAIVLVGGTGSNCLGYNSQGKTAKAGGLNFILSDDGSGYDAGRLALKALLRGLDGRGPQTALESAIFAHFHLRNLSELKNYLYQPLIKKREVAALAPLVLQSARAGDPGASAIISYCADQLLLHVQAVATNLDLINQNFDLILTGSFLLNMLPEFKPHLIATLPGASIVSQDIAPVYGAIKLAQKITNGEKIHKLLLN